MIETEDTLNSFVRYLLALDEADDRAALASLRRGVGQQPGSVLETARIVERRLELGTPPSVRNACYIVGSLFALHHESVSSNGDMGKHFRKICGDLKPGDELPRNIERRFMSVLASDKDELPDALRQAVSLLKSKDIPVNWFRLAQDVQQWHWDNEREQVCKKWARGFWNTEKTTEPSAAIENQSVTE